MDGEIKLVDSELKVMDVLWKEGEAPARYVANVMTEKYGWNVNTTYTLLKRCIYKGAVERTEPNFICKAILPREKVQHQEVDALLQRLFDGSADKLFSALLSGKRLTTSQIQNLRELVEQYEDEGDA